MRSSACDLVKRGFLPEGDEAAYANLPIAMKLKLLSSCVATERTLAARLLLHESGCVAGELMKALRIETKLYSKIEICRALEAHHCDSVPLLVDALGCIGSNQHAEVPTKGFAKSSYPLPRDIAARTLGRIGEPALPWLLAALSSGNRKQLSEAIDAIGFICFYSDQPHVLEALEQCYLQHASDDLIQWKVVRAMSGFPEGLPFIASELATCHNVGLRLEMHRSVRLMERGRRR